jgi:hypothetical protein
VAKSPPRRCLGPVCCMLGSGVSVGCLVLVPALWLVAQSQSPVCDMRVGILNPLWATRPSSAGERLGGLFIRPVIIQHSAC